MRAKQLDLSFDKLRTMPAKSEDDIKTERILMQEMVETGAIDVVPDYLTEYRIKMKRHKALKAQRKWDDE